MADAIAVLGLEVDAAGALRSIEKVDNELKQMGRTATAAAGSVQQVGPASTRSAEAMRVNADAARANAARLTELQMTATRTATASASLAGALGTLGGPIGIASIAAMQGLNLVLQLVADRSKVAADRAKEEAKARDEATEAAKRYREEEAGGIAAATIKNLQAKAAEIDALTKAMENANRAARFSQSGAIGSGTGVVVGGGADPALLAQREKALEDQRTLQRQFNALQLEAEQNAEASKTRERNALLKGDRAIAADRAAAIEKLRFDLARLQHLQTAAAGGADNLGERAKLAESIASTRAALDAAGVAADKSAAKLETAADKVLKAEQQYFTALAKTVAASDDSVEKYLDGLTRERLAGLDAAEKHREELADIAALRDKANKNAAETISQLEFQVSLIGKSKQEQEGLIDLENYRLAIAQQFSQTDAERFVRLQRELRQAASATDDWGDAVRDVLVGADAIASAFGGIGSAISDAIRLAAQLGETLSKAAAARAAAGTPGAGAATQSASDARNALAGAATASFIGFSVGMLADGFRAMGEANQRAAERIAEAARALEAFNSSLVTFNRSLAQVGQGEFESARTRLGEQIGGLFEGLAQRFTSLKVPANGQVTADYLRDLLDGGNGPGRVAKPAGELARALEELAKSAERAEAALRKEQAEKIKGLAEDLGVRRLRAEGHSEEADALALQLAQTRELNAAIRDLSGAEGFDGFITALREVQAAEQAAAEAARALATARRITDLNNETLAFSDPRGAGQAAFDESLTRRYADAVERGASAAELAAIAAYNLAAAADFAAQQLEEDTRTTESLIARILSASGDARAAEDFSFAAGQRQEMADAIRAGMSEGNLALLRFTQMAERSQLQMQRAIEDGTKAILDQAKNEIAAIDVLIEVTQSVADAALKKIDEQIEATQTAARATAKAFDAQISAIREATKAQTDAIDAQIDSARDALDAAQKQLSVLEKSVQTNGQIVTAMRDLRDSLKLGALSPLSPEDKLAEARAQFERTAAAAAGGDSAAALKVPAAAQALLEASRAYNASGPGFVSDFNRVNDVLNAIEAQYGATLPVEEAQLEAARQAVESLQQTIESLGEQKEAITEAASRQIDAIQTLKDKAAEDAQRTIDKLNEQKDVITEDTRQTIDKLEEQKTAINAAAQAQIDQLVKIETEAHLSRLRQDEYWQTFLGLTEEQTLTGEPVRRLVPLGVGTTASAPLRVAEEQLTEARGMRQELLTLREEIAKLRADGQTGNDIAVGASNDEVVAIGHVVTELRQLIQETRNTNQANNARAASRR